MKPMSEEDRTSYFVKLAFLKGRRVATPSEVPRRDFTNPENRRANARGTIKENSSGHGLCFLVEYDDGGEGWFDADELSIDLSELMGTSR